MPARLSPALEAEIRGRAAMFSPSIAHEDRRDLLAELDAVRRERDEALRQRQMNADAANRFLEERGEAVKVAATMRDALERIANFKGYGPGSMNAIARAALAAVPSSTEWPGVRLTAAEAEQAESAMQEMLAYVSELEARYSSQVAVRSYLSFPQDAQGIGDRYRATLKLLAGPSEGETAT